MVMDVVPEPLRRRYVESFPAKVVAMEAALAALDHDGSVGKELRDLAHKLAGSAGMYGFDDLGRQARDLVHALDARAGQAQITELARALIASLTRG
jgi:HPt (histidine-containing phosphotransfer) domain-containing protein